MEFIGNTFIYKSFTQTIAVFRVRMGALRVYTTDFTNLHVNMKQRWPIPCTKHSFSTSL